MTLEAQLRALDAMDIVGLRRAWRPAYGKRPDTRSTELLRRLIAWELQAAVHGGLDRATRDALRRTDAFGTRAKPAIGSCLSREWKGVRYEVEVTADGYSYAGENYRSLSIIASQIAGTRWNGWRFFGLGEPPLATRQAAVR